MNVEKSLKFSKPNMFIFHNTDVMIVLKKEGNNGTSRNCYSLKRWQVET